MAPLTELNFPNPIETKPDLFDRDDELQMIQENLLSPVRRPGVIQGERVMGKTSLLNIVVEWAGQDDRFVVLQLPHVMSREAFIEEILEGMAAEAGTSLHRLGQRDDQGRMRLSAVTEFVRVASDLAASLREKQVLLCLEELDSLLVNCRDDSAANDILGFILHVVQKTRLPVKFLFTITRMPPQIVSSHASVFMSGALIAKLRTWNYEESRDFVDDLLRGVMAFDTEAHRALFAAGGGHAYFTKAVLQALVAVDPDPPALRRVTGADVQAAVAAAVTMPEVDFTLTNIATAHFTEDEIRLLRHLAFGTGEIGMPSRIGSPDALHNLVDRRYLRADGSRYSHAFGLLGEWMKERHWSGSSASVGRDGAVPTMFIDDNRGLVFIGENELRLTPQEHSFLNCLAEHSGSVVDRYTIATEVWPGQVADGLEEGRLNALVWRLRGKLGREVSEKYIETRTGRGYYLNPEHVQRVRG